MATAELSKTQVIHHDGQITSPEQIQTGEVYRRVGKLNTGLPAGRTLFIPLMASTIFRLIYTIV